MQGKGPLGRAIPLKVVQRRPLRELGKQRIRQRIWELKGNIVMTVSLRGRRRKERGKRKEGLKHQGAAKRRHFSASTERGTGARLGSQSAENSVIKESTVSDEEGKDTDSSFTYELSASLQLRGGIPAGSPKSDKVSLGVILRHHFLCPRLWGHHHGCHWYCGLDRQTIFSTNAMYRSSLCLSAASRLLSSAFSSTVVLAKCWQSVGFVCESICQTPRHTTTPHKSEEEARHHLTDVRRALNIRPLGQLFLLQLTNPEQTCPQTDHFKLDPIIKAKDACKPAIT
ncbi:UNVERIFIED_CONTAM: hypothetical protein FKN15_008638 [Acipenser sinensis]